MDKKELQILKNVLNNDYGFQLIRILLHKLGAFERGYNMSLDDKEIWRTLAKREQGFWLLDCVYYADKSKLIDLIDEERKDIIL